MTTQKKLDQAMKHFLNSGPVQEIPCTRPTTKNMNRKFKMKVDRSGKPSMQEVD